MTAPAFSLSVVLPGAPSSAAPAGGAPAGAEGLFGGLLTSLIDDGSTDSPGDWTLHKDAANDAGATDGIAEDLIQTDPAATALDPALALMLASLGMTPAAAAPAETGQSGDSAFTPVPGRPGSRFTGFQLPDQMAPTPDMAAVAGPVPLATTGAAGLSGLATGSDASPVERLQQSMTPSLRPNASADAAPVAANVSASPAAPAPVVPTPAPAPPPTPVATTVAATPGAEAEIAEASVAAPTGKNGTAPDGDTRRTAGPSRADRREASARSSATAVGAVAPRTELSAATTSADSAAMEADVGADPAPEADTAEVAAAPEAPQPSTAPEARTPATLAPAQIAEAPARGTPETVARLAADIVRKVEGQSTRFDLQLDPHGLGKVDVAIEIDREGKLTAALSFESAQSALDLRGRAGELRHALEQAGFDIAEGGLTFDLSGQNAGFGGREAGQQQERAWTGRAFQRAQAGAEDIDLSLTNTPSTSSRWTRSGVDIRI